jgi:hypothetical protein
LSVPNNVLLPCLGCYHAVFSCVATMLYRCHVWVATMLCFRVLLPCYVVVFRSLFMLCCGVSLVLMCV